MESIALIYVQIKGLKHAYQQLEGELNLIVDYFLLLYQHIDKYLIFYRVNFDDISTLQLLLDRWD